MEELHINEIDSVSGGLALMDWGFVGGFVMGAGAWVQRRIDRMHNPMLGMMQYGA
jgi:hypothetical protein